MGQGCMSNVHLTFHVEFEQSWDKMDVCLKENPFGQ
jgi:hypothetical protein